VPEPVPEAATPLAPGITLFFFGDTGGSLSAVGLNTDGVATSIGRLIGPTPGTLAPPPAGGPPASFGLDFFFVVGAVVLALRICPSGPIFDCAGFGGSSERTTVGGGGICCVCRICGGSGLTDARRR